MNRKKSNRRLVPNSFEEYLVEKYGLSGIPLHWRKKLFIDHSTTRVRWLIYKIWKYRAKGYILHQRRITEFDRWVVFDEIQSILWKIDYHFGIGDD